MYLPILPQPPLMLIPTLTNLAHRPCLLYPIGTLTSKQRAAAVLSDAPKVAAMLEYMRTCLADARHTSSAFLSDVQFGNVTTHEGLVYLEAEIPLLSESIHVLILVLLKCIGKCMRERLVLSRFVRYKIYNGGWGY